MYSLRSLKTSITKQQFILFYTYFFFLTVNKKNTWTTFYLELLRHQCVNNTGVSKNEFATFAVIIKAFKKMLNLSGKAYNVDFLNNIIYILTGTTTGHPPKPSEAIMQKHRDLILHMWNHLPEVIDVDTY